MRAPVIITAIVVVGAAAAGAWFLFRAEPPAPAPVTARPPATRAPAPRATAPAAPAPVASAPARRDPAVPKALASEAAPVAAAPTATLRIETDVPDALVLIDRVGAGTAPITIPNLSIGSHRVDVAAAGYDRHVETVELEAGTRTLRVVFKEIRLAEKVDVIHKHGVGSCKGELTASPQGLRYEPAQGNDGFSAALTDVETLDVDYIAKNLRVRVKGRTLNFTVADGNAEPLAVFQANVDKARARIRAQE